jgi:hypothetical protein
MKSGGLDQNDSDDKTFKYEFVSSGGVKRKIGGGEQQHTIPVQGSCTEHAEAVKLLSSVCLLLQDLVQKQSCLRRGRGGYGRTCATRDDEPRPVWTRPPITH